MNVGFHHERIGSQSFDRLRINLMSCRNKQSTDLIDRLRPQPTHVVTNRAPLKFRVLVPGSKSHDGSQLDVILRQIMNLIVCVITPEPNARQHQNVPVVHAFAASLRRRLAVDVTADQFHDLFSHVGFGIVTVLQHHIGSAMGCASQPGASPSIALL